MSGNGFGDGELSIQEAWQTLVRYRVAALISFLVVVLAAGLFLGRAKPTYEVEGSFYIGRLGDTAIDPPTLVTQRIESAFRKYRAIPGASLATVTPDRRDPRLIRVMVRGTSPQAAQKLADEIMANVLEGHARQVAAKTDALTSELRDLRKLSEEGHLAMEKLKRQGHAGSDTATALMYSTVELAVIRTRIGDLEQQLRDKIDPTEVIARPEVGKTPIGPNNEMVMVLALIAGTLSALVVPFFIHIVSTRRSA